MNPATPAGERKRAMAASFAEKMPGADEEGLFELGRARLQRAGVDAPTVTLRFRNLSVSADVEVGHRNLPSLLSPLRAFSAERTRLPIVDGASGVLEPGVFTLLLGPPGSGKTTLLQTLAGINRGTKGLTVRADELSYNGRGFDEFVVERTSAYVNQYDMHYGELTVRETFDFSARCLATGYRKNVMDEVVRREREAGIIPDPVLDEFQTAICSGTRGNPIADVVIQALGLDICADTPVGNPMLRGISGGQKKRVTAGEMLVGPAKIIMLDEVSTGLDSSTTFTIMSILRQYAHVTRTTILCGLLQPQPETFDLFDEVMLLSSGRICFHGPRDMVLPFFGDLGFVCPERRGVADFLQEITTSTDQEKYYSSAKAGRAYRFVNAQEIQGAFRKTAHWRAVAEKLDTPVPLPVTAERDVALVTTKYGASYSDLLRANFGRMATLQKRSKVIIGIRLFQLMLMGFVVATLFVKTGHDTLADGNLYFGVVFFSVLIMLLGAISEMHMLVERMAVMFRQRDALFYPGWCFAIPAFVMRLPWAAIESTAWSLIVYFAVGFEASTRFLMFWLQLFTINVYSVSLFMTVAAVTKNDTLAISVASFLMLLLVNTTGFVLNAAAIPAMWKGAFWANPFAWTTRALGINELTAPQWGALGPEVLEFRGFPTEYKWVWAAIGMALGCTLLNLAAFVLACTYNTAPKKHAPVSPEAMAELAAARSAPSAEIEYRSATYASGREVDLEMRVVDIGPASPPVRRAAIEFEPVWMTFRDVEYSVPVPEGADESRMDVPTEGPHAGQLRLLHKINGVFRPNVLCALMGASGAGKTTLMDVLAGRKTGGIVTGDVRVNAFPKEQGAFSRVSGYVEQTDIHLPETTVEEALRFSASLRLPTTTDEVTRNLFVDEVLDLVDLAGLRDSHVGKPGVSGLSVEQRKRLTLGVELSANPSIIFMDEPTSGLDARAASVVMRAIRDTVNTGRTCVCTIHQPSVDIFEAFDELLLLKPGGRTIYFGPLGEDMGALIEYFTGVPGVLPIKPRYNAAAWMLEETTPAKEKRLEIDFSREYAESELAKSMASVIAEFETPKDGAKPVLEADMALPGYAHQFRTNLGRFWRAYYRNPDYNLTRLVTTTLVSLVFGSMFWNQGSEEHRTTVEGVLNIAGVIFSGTLFVGVSNCMTVQPMIFMQREVFYRERAAGMVSVLPYALAQQLVELPYLLVQTTIASAIMYWMIGFVASASSFFMFWWLFFLVLLFFTLWGMLGVALTPALPLANVFVSFFFGFWNLLSGFLIQRPSIGWWWRWASYLTPCQYQIYGLVTSQLGNLYTENITNTFVTPPVVQTVPEFVEEQFGFEYSSLWTTVGVQIGFIVACSAIITLAIAKLNFQKR